MIESPFLDRSKWFDEIGGDYLGAFAVWDGFPVSKGHALVLPKQLCVSWSEMCKEELANAWILVKRVRERLIAEFAPDAFTIGINDGEAAGQTVAHAHIHIIPRYRGDVPNPRGGIRGVIPGKASY